MQPLFCNYMLVGDSHYAACHDTNCGDEFLWHESLDCLAKIEQSLSSVKWCGYWAGKGITDESISKTLRSFQPQNGGVFISENCSIRSYDDSWIVHPHTIFSIWKWVEANHSGCTNMTTLITVIKLQLAPSKAVSAQPQWLLEKVLLQETLGWDNHRAAWHFQTVHSLEGSIPCI